MHTTIATTLADWHVDLANLSDVPEDTIADLGFELLDFVTHGDPSPEERHDAIDVMIDLGAEIVRRCNEEA